MDWGPSAAWFYEDQLRLHQNINIILQTGPVSFILSAPHLQVYGKEESGFFIRKLDVSFNSPRTVVLNLFHCWDPLNATDVVWDPQVKIEKVCAPE